MRCRCSAISRTTWPRGLETGRTSSDGWLFEDDVELLMTYLAQPQPWLDEAERHRNNALVLEISGVIRDAIDRCVDKVLRRPSPDWLRHLVRYWHKNRSLVITLNYDTLVERAAHEVQVVANENDPTGDKRSLLCSDIYPVPMPTAASRNGSVSGNDPVESFMLAKLHGSSNWFHSRGGAISGDPIFYVPVSAGWSVNDALLKRSEDSHRAKVRDKTPFIVPPLADKIGYFRHEVLTATWDRAAQSLRDAKRCFALGYSFPKTDLTMQFFLLGNAPRKPVELHVVNLTDEAFAQCKDLFSSHYDVRPMISADAIPSLVGEL